LKAAELFILGVAIACVVGARPASAQIPDTFTNLQHFPEDISRDALMGQMRRISLSLGVRCQFCHVGSVDGTSFEGVDFASDDDPRKVTARWMLGMVNDLNSRVATELPDRDAPRTEMSCKTCHRGVSNPRLLSQELRLTLELEGASGLADAYARARLRLESGAYDFGEWEINLLAEDLESEGRSDDAIAILEMNLAHHPTSPSILGNLGRLFEARGSVEQAITTYERLLEIQPENTALQARIAALRGGERP
jgi:hypothetical protein